MVNVKPTDCALCIGIPLTREEFLRDAAEPEGERDFVRNYRRTHPAPIEYTWEHDYAKLVDLLESVILNVKSLGVRVVRDCTAKNLQDTLALDYKAIALMAHFRSSLFLPSDIIFPVGLAERLLEGEQIVMETMRSRGGSEFVSQLQQLIEYPTESIRTSVIASINRILTGNLLAGDEHASDNLEGSDGGLLYQDRIHQNRVYLDASLGGLARRGGCLELRDGMHPVSEFGSWLNPGIERVLDLTLCNSVIQSAEIHRKRKGWTVVTNRNETRLEFRAPLYRHTIRALAAHSGPYIDVVSELIKGVGQEISKKRTYE